MFAIVEKNGKVSKNTSDDELHSWQESTHLETFQFEYDADQQLPDSSVKKLLVLQRALLKKGDQLSYVEAEISDNYTDVQLKSAFVVPVNVNVPQSLIDARKNLFKQSDNRLLSNTLV